MAIAAPCRRDAGCFAGSTASVILVAGMGNADTSVRLTPGSRRGWPGARRVAAGSPTAGNSLAGLVEGIVGLPGGVGSVRSAANRSLPSHRWQFVDQGDRRTRWCISPWRL